MSWPHKREEFYGTLLEDKATRPSTWFIYLAAWVIRPLAWLWTRYEVCGKENLSSISSAVIAANHLSFFDPIILWVAFYPRIVHFMARSSLFRPLIGGLIARAGAFPVDPESADRTSIKRAVSIVKSGEFVGIFPEGTRMNRPDKVYKPHAGVILIAQMGKVPIIPVGISGTERIRPYGTYLPRFPKVYVNIGKPINPADYKDLPKRQRTQSILDDLMKAIHELVQDAASACAKRKNEQSRSQKV